MNATLVDNSVRVEEVLGYENPDLVNRYKTKLGLSDEEAALLFADTKRFLCLCGTTPGRWSPTKKIDEGWHNFILFTRDYDEFCRRHFGRFIHHEPQRISAPAKDSASSRETFQAACQMFGDDLSHNWLPEPAATSECSKSGCNCSPDSGGGGSECSPS